MITTARLDLQPATVAMLDAALEGGAALARALACEVPAGWPPELLDAGALEWTRDRLAADAGSHGWWMYFPLLRRPGQPPILVGSAGYKGPPTDEGVVEIGYSIVPEYQRQGLASEAAAALVRYAFAHAAVQSVVAETFPELTGSIRVLERCGFAPVAGASEPGALRYGIGRPRRPTPSRTRP